MVKLVYQNYELNKKRYKKEAQAYSNHKKELIACNITERKEYRGVKSL